MATAPSSTPEEIAAAEAEDRRLLARLRDGDADAFAMLVRRWNPSLLRVARQHVATQAIAEEVVGDTWVGVLTGLDRFEGRSSVRTWVYRILLNQARTRGVRERRTIPFASLARDEADEPFAAVDPSRFHAPGHPRGIDGHWASPPARWDESPEASLETNETMAMIRAAIAELPPVQRLVMALRDIEGWPSADVCAALDITEGNQRVLLHRARSRVRATLEPKLAT